MVNVHDLASAAAARRRVLVVEDNLDSVHSMAVLVKMMGHEVQFAINGFAALAIAREFRPDFVLLDLGLPDFNGCEIARRSGTRGSSRSRRFPRASTGRLRSGPDATSSMRSPSTRGCSSGSWEMRARQAAPISSFGLTWSTQPPTAERSVYSASRPHGWEGGR
jgi:hypothetical protein